MYIAPESAPASHSSLSFDISTLKQRRYQYKAFRKDCLASNSDVSNEVLDKRGQVRSMVQDICISDRSCSPGSLISGLNLNENFTSALASNLRRSVGRDTEQTISVNMNSEPNEHNLFAAASPKEGHAIFKEINHSQSLTPKKLSGYSLRLAQTPKATESSNLMQHFEWLESLEADKSGRNIARQGCMTPDSKSSADSNILHKDLLSYKTARQIVKNLTDSGFIKKNGSDKEFSRSLEPVRRSWNSIDDLDHSKTIGETDRKGFINGLERFYKRNNLEVLEEDESPSEDIEKTYSKARDSHRKTNFQKRLEYSDGQLSDKVMNAEPRDSSADYMYKKAESKKFKSLVKKFSVTMDQIDEKPQAKRKASVEKEKSVTKTTSIGLKKISFDGCDEQTKSRLTKTLLRTQDGLKTIEEQQKHKQKSLQNTFTEQKSKPDTPNITSEISKSRSRQRNTTAESQSTNLSSSTKKLRLNNWMRPDLLCSKCPKSRTSPKNRPKEVPVTPIKKSQMSEIYKKKLTENKGTITGSSISLNSGNINFVNGGSGRSTANTGSVETSDNILKMAIGEGLISTVTVERLKKTENIEIKNTNTGGVGSRANIGYLINTRNIENSKETKPGKSKDPIQKDIKKEGISRLRLATDESDKLSERKLYNDIFSEENIRDKKIERSSSKESGMVEKATPTTYSSKRMAMLNKKLTVDVVSSPKLKDSKEEKKSSLLKEIQERIKENSPTRTRGLSGVTNTTAKKSNDVSGASYGNISIEPVTASKLKSPLSQTVKNTKIFGFEKDKNPVLTKYKDLKEMRTKMNSKKIRSSNNSKEWKNLDEVKGLDTLEGPNTKMSGDFILATDLAVKDDHQPQQEAKSSDTNRGLELHESHDKFDKANKVSKKESDGKSLNKKKEVDEKGESSSRINLAQKNKNQPNMKIPSNFFKSLGIGMQPNMKNTKSSMQIPLGGSLKLTSKDK